MTTTSAAASSTISATGRVVRIVSAIAAVAVPLLNGTLGWHLTTTDVIGVVAPLTILVLAESHVDAALTGATPAAITEQMGQILTGMANVLREIPSTKSTHNPATTTSATTTATDTTSAAAKMG